MTDQEPEQAHLEGFLSVRAALQSGSREIHSLLLRRDKEDGQTRWLERQAAARRHSHSPSHRRGDRGAGGGQDARRRPGHRRPAPLRDAGRPAAAGRRRLGRDAGRRGRPLQLRRGGPLPVRRRRGGAGGAAPELAVRRRRGRARLGGRVRTHPHRRRRDGRRSRRRSFGRAASKSPARRTRRPRSPCTTPTCPWPLFLLIGGEKRGITRSFEAAADLRLRIPYARPEAYSLGTAAAAAVLGFEIMRQRRVNSRG